MKRMINGAVSDISYALPMSPMALNDTDNTLDLVLVPGGHVLMSHPDLLRTNSGSLQLLPITESGRTTPCSDAQSDSGLKTPVQGGQSVVTEPLLEVSEEEEESHKSSDEDLSKKGGDALAKDCSTQKSHQPWKGEETPTSINKTQEPVTQEDLGQKCEIQKATPKTEESKTKQTASIGVQVNLSKSMSSPNLNRRYITLDPINLEDIEGNRRLRRPLKCIGGSHSAPRSPKGESPGYSHLEMLGEDTESKSYAWRRELSKYQNQSKKGLKVSQLIGTFNRQGSPAPEDPKNIKCIKQKRRGSLQINIESSLLDELDKSVEAVVRRKKDDSDREKILRRKSTSSIVTGKDKRFSDILSNPKEEAKAIEKSDSELVKATLVVVPEPLKEESEETQPAEEKATVGATPVPLQDASSLGPNLKKKNWDYFEIDHPKAISDKKLQQLKLKYQRRKTDGAIFERNKAVIEEDEELSLEHTSGKETKAKTVPYKGEDVDESLELAIDPMTGECITNGSKVADVKKDDFNVSRRSSRSSKRRSSHLADIQEQIPEEKVLEMRIDPLTGVVETLEVKKANSKVSQEDDGIGSLPHTPTDLLERPPMFANSEDNLAADRRLTDDSNSLSSWDDLGRPSSAQAVTSSSGNVSTTSSSSSTASSVNRMLSGAFNRAMERYSSSIRQSESQNQTASSSNEDIAVIGLKRPSSS